MTSDEQAFIAAIKAAPDDDAPRLIYADWLDEQERHRRATLIRWQCSKRGHSVDLFCPKWSTEKQWHWLSVPNTFPNVPVGKTSDEFPQPEHDCYLKVDRGFVAEVDGNPKWLLENLDRLTGTNPTETVRFLSVPELQRYDPPRWPGHAAVRIFFRHAPYPYYVVEISDLHWRTVLDGAYKLLKATWPIVKTWQLPGIDFTTSPQEWLPSLPEAVESVRQLRNLRTESPAR